MITEVENIILNKEYFELTPEELERVSELVQGAEEYDEMKWFLGSAADVLQTDRIEASPQLKEKVMTHLHQQQGNRRFWLNGITIFMWPTDKEFYRRPAFQMSLAAILLIGFLMVYNRNIEPEGTMAVNQKVEMHDPNTTNEGNTEPGTAGELTDDDGATLEGSAELDNVNQPTGGATPYLGKSGVINSNPNDNKLSATQGEPVTTVTDADGFYYRPAETEEMLYDSNLQADDISVDNATNNERPGKLIETKVERDQENRGDRYKNDEAVSEEESEKNRSRFEKSGYKKSKESKKEINSNEVSDMSKSEDTSDETQPANFGSGNTGGAEIEMTEDPTSTGIYNTATLDQGYGKDNVSDIIPYQQSIKQTVELKSLFATFK